MKDGIIIGLDLNEFEAQICRYDEKSQRPENVMVTAGGTKASYPAHMAYLPKEEKWKYGLEADYFIKHKGAVSVNGFLKKCLKEEPFRAEGVDYPISLVLSEFIKQSLTLAGITDPAGEIGVFVLTTPEITREFAKTAKEAFSIIGFENGQAYIQDYAESFFFHTFYQKPDVYKKDTALYYFPNEHEVAFIAIGMNNSTRPATVSQKNYQRASLASDDKQRDEDFAMFIKQTIDNGNYSGAFLVGKGFDTEWAQNSLAALCRGQRKVFYGNNLFAKGACFSAMEKGIERKINDYIYIGDDLVTENIGMEMLIDGEPGYKGLITAGVHWYEAESKIEFILNSDPEIIFRASSMRDGARRKFKMKLDGLPVRPAKTTRIRLLIRYEEKGRCVIKAEDMGFGDMFPSSHLVWEEEVPNTKRMM